jgi:hypothetical protein
MTNIFVDENYKKRGTASRGNAAARRRRSQKPDKNTWMALRVPEVHQEVTKPKAIVHTRLNKRRKARCSKLGLGEDDDFSFEQDEKARAAIKPLEKNCSKLPLKKRPLRNNESISVGGHAASTSTGKLTKSPLFKAWRKNVSKQKTSTGVGVGKQDNSKDDMDETAIPVCKARTKRMEILKSAMANENEAVSAPPSEQVWNDDMDETDGAMDTTGVETDADIMDESASPVSKARTKRREILKATMPNKMRLFLRHQVNKFRMTMTWMKQMVLQILQVWKMMVTMMEEPMEIHSNVFLLSKYISMVSFACTAKRQLVSRSIPFLDTSTSIIQSYCQVLVPRKSCMIAWLPLDKD